MLCVCSQGAGNVRGMTVPSAVPRRLPPAISAHAPFARSTRKGHSPPPRSTAVSAAPVTTLLVRWAPTPALPSHTAPPPARSEWKRSQRQRRTQWLPSDSSAQLNTSFPVKYATVGLQATSGLKQRAMKGNPVLYDQCCGPHTKRRHTDEHLSAVCGTSSVLTGKASRHHLRCFLWFSLFFFCHETPPIRPCTAQLCPLGGTTPSLCYIPLSLFRVGEIVSVVSHLDIPALWWNEVRLRKQRQGEGEARSKLSISSTTEPLHFLFTCCKTSLTHRRSLSPPLQPVFTPNMVCIPITQFLLGEGDRVEWLNLCNFCFPWDHTTFQCSYICF